jgi:broad specificity phosphatase PhoE
MAPKQIVLIRHGESEGNVDRSVYARKPDHRIELTENGRRQAFETGKELQNLLGTQDIHFYVSPHLRSRQTYEELAKSLTGQQKRHLHEDPRLREQEWGHFRTEAQTRKLEKVRYQYGTFYYRFPNGESGADVYDRVSAFLETIHRDFEKEDYPKNVVIVTHGLTIRLFLMRWFHVPVEEYESWANPKNCQYYILRRMGKHYIMPEMEKDGWSRRKSKSR